VASCCLVFWAYVYDNLSFVFKGREKFKPQKIKSLMTYQTDTHVPTPLSREIFLELAKQPDYWCNSGNRRNCSIENWYIWDVTLREGVPIVVWCRPSCKRLQILFPLKDSNAMNMERIFRAVETRLGATCPPAWHTNVMMEVSHTPFCSVAFGDFSLEKLKEVCEVVFKVIQRVKIVKTT